MQQRIIPWVNPYTKEKLVQSGEFLLSNSFSFPILNGIPNFTQNLKDEKQLQVQDSFGEKWTTSSFGQNDNEFENIIKPIYLEMMGLAENDLDIFTNQIILEVGIGSGSSSRIWGPQAQEFHGVDISKAVYQAQQNLKNSIPNAILSQADVNYLPYEDEIFDIIVSNGVFHHTPSTKNALRNTLDKLKVDGFCIFYIYKKKSPLREFADDYIRAHMSLLDYEEAWLRIKPLTELGKALHEQNIQINIPVDVEILGIKKGKYDLQRFIYDHIFKCFWNDSWGYDYSNLVNVDWYHPKYCWRHTEDEIRSWCSEMNLTINYIKELQSGFACSVIKN